MVRQGVAKLLLVVEGEDDQFILREHVTEDLLLVLGVGGKESLLEAARLSEERGVTGVRYLVDADYDALVHPGSSYAATVISSTHHDLMMDVVNASPVLLERTIQTHSRKAARRGIEVDAESWRREALVLAARIAPLRMVNHRHDLGLNLRNFPIGTLSSVNPIDAELAKITIGRSETALLANDLIGLMAAETAIADSHPPEVLAGDHDLFRALARVMKSKGVTAGAEEMLNSCIAALTCEYLCMIEVFRKVAAWCSENSKAAFTCVPVG